MTKELNKHMGLSSRGIANPTSNNHSCVLQAIHATVIIKNTVTHSYVIARFEVVVLVTDTELFLLEVTPAAVRPFDTTPVTAVAVEGPGIRLVLATPTVLRPVLTFINIVNAISG